MQDKISVKLAKISGPQLCWTSKASTPDLNKTEQGNPITILKNLKINRTRNPTGGLPVLPPSVYCGPYPTGDETCPLDIIQHNPFDTVLLAWEKAHQAGCSRIALLLPTQTSAPSNLELQTLAAYRLLQEQSARNDPKLKPLVTHFERLRSDPEILKNWFARTQPDVILGGFQALYFFLRDHLEDFSDCCPFIALRAMGNDDEVAGYTLEREVVAEIALRRLHALIQDPMPAMSRSVSLVVNPTWKPGKSFQPTA